MPDYYTFQQAIQTLGITEANITELQRKGVLLLMVKDGRSFLSSQQVYRLRVAVRWAQEALAKVEEH